MWRACMLLSPWLADLCIPISSIIGRWQLWLAYCHRNCATYQVYHWPVRLCGVEPLRNKTASPSNCGHHLYPLICLQKFSTLVWLVASRGLFVCLAVYKWTCTFIYSFTQISDCMNIIGCWSRSMHECSANCSLIYDMHTGPLPTFLQPTSVTLS